MASSAVLESLDDDEAGPAVGLGGPGVAPPRCFLVAGGRLVGEVKKSLLLLLLLLMMNDCCCYYYYYFQNRQCLPM
jgi:hypothetical protein